MTIHELHIKLDLQSENKIGILNDIATYYGKGYLFVDSSDGKCYLFDENGNEDDIKKLKMVDANLFYGSNIESIAIPNSIEWIGHWSFAFCRNLKSIVIPDSIEWIGECAFTFCENLKSIVIPDSVKYIRNRVFYKCESLKSLFFIKKTIDQVKAMENYPFGIEDESIIRCI